MPIDWEKVKEDDGEAFSFHESMVEGTPFNNTIKDYEERFGPVAVDERHDIGGLHVRMMVWERDDGGYGSMMFVEDEIFDDTMFAEGDSPQDVIQRTLDVFAIGSPVVVEDYKFEGMPVKVFKGGQGFAMWAMDRNHLFERENGTFQVKDKYLKTPSTDKDQ